MEITLTLAGGPRLEAGIDKGVHLIFYPPNEAAPGAQHPPSDQELEALARALTAAQKEASPIQETDVIVFRGLPWHMVNGKLKKHPQVHHDHPHTVLELKVEVQRGVWWSEEHFTIESITKHSEHTPAAAPAQPFARPDTGSEPDVSGRVPVLHVARSTPPVRAALKAEYKLSFKRNGRLIDPNMRCT